LGLKENTRIVNTFNNNYFFLFSYFRNTFCIFPSSPNIPANCLEIDKSNTTLYVGHDNGYIGYINVQKNSIVNKFKAHDSAVNSLGINLTNSDLYSVGSDGLLNVWQ